MKVAEGCGVCQVPERGFEQGEGSTAPCQTRDVTILTCPGVVHDGDFGVVVEADDVTNRFAKRHGVGEQFDEKRSGYYVLGEL